MRATRPTRRVIRSTEPWSQRRRVLSAAALNVQCRSAERSGGHLRLGVNEVEHDHVVLPFFAVTVTLTFLPGVAPEIR